MSDQETPAAEAAAPETNDNPWGDDFDANTAWGLVTKLRGIEKDSVPKAEKYEKLASGEDPDTLKEILEAYGYEISDTNDEEDDPIADEWEDPSVAKLAQIEKDNIELKKFKESIEAERQVQAFEGQLTTLSKDKDLDLDEWDKRAIFAAAFDGTTIRPKEVEKAFAQFAERAEARNKALIEGYTKSKSAPRGPVRGESASEVPDLKTTDDMTDYIKSRLDNQ